MLRPCSCTKHSTTRTTPGCWEHILAIGCNTLNSTLCLQQNHSFGVYSNTLLTFTAAKNNSKDLRLAKKYQIKLWRQPFKSYQL